MTGDLEPGRAPGTAAPPGGAAPCRLRVAVAGDESARAAVSALVHAAGLEAEVCAHPGDAAGDLVVVVGEGNAAAPEATDGGRAVLRVAAPGAGYERALPPGWLRWSRLPAALAALVGNHPDTAAARARETRRAAAFAASGAALLAARGVDEVAARLCALAIEVSDAQGSALYRVPEAGSAWHLLHRAGTLPAAEPELPPADDPAQWPNGDAIVLSGAAAAPFGANTAVLAPLRCENMRFLQVFAWARPHTVERAALRSIRRVIQLGALTLAHAHRMTELENANRLKAEFVATVSHELRTPLNAILGYTDLLLDGEFGNLADEQRQVLRRAENSAAGLLDLINSTLEAMRFDVADTRVETVEVRFADLAEKVAREVGSTRHRQPARIVHRDSPDLSLRTDPARLRLLLRQLLHAALAGSRGAALEMRASATRHDAVIEVADAEILDAERGAPVLLDLEAPAPLAGPGLYTARRLAEILEGSLTLWTTDDRRLIFRLTLPLDPSP